MKTNFLVSLIAVIAVIALTAGMVSAALITSNEVKVNGISIEDYDVAAEAGEVVPVTLQFTAEENASEVQISAWMNRDSKNRVEVNFKDLIAGKEYVARLSLRLPSDINPEENRDLTLRIESDNGNWENTYTLGMQRIPYNADLIFVEMDSQVTAGSTTSVDIVVKNDGRHDLNDLVVEASIPELGVSKRAYFGDLVPVDECDTDNCDKQDSVQGRISLKIPSNAKTGTYEVKIKATNDDTESTVKKQISVVGSELEASVIAPVSTKEMSKGETVNYDVVIVNSGSNIAVFELVPASTEDLIVSVENPVVTVQAGSSQTVKVSATALKEGTYSFAVDVNSDNQPVKKINFTAKVSSKPLASNVVVLTIVLAIVLVVLLIVLIVLLTRKPARSEELEESYY
ncbi:MAG: hypothetical protein NT076_05795 [Candidatus Pacearchaeota archaeon]|nr:hypothetical protein [Candidatus Pacearchaeota archaeon]